MIPSITLHPEEIPKRNKKEKNQKSQVLRSPNIFLFITIISKISSCAIMPHITLHLSKPKHIRYLQFNTHTTTHIHHLTWKINRSKEKKIHK